MLVSGASGWGAVGRTVTPELAPEVLERLYAYPGTTGGLNDYRLQSVKWLLQLTSSQRLLPAAPS